MTPAVDLGGTCDVAIIGAGPAGMAAAALTAHAGLSTIMLDENPGVGGQIHRSIGSTPVRKESILGGDYWGGQSLVRALRETRARFVPNATVWSLSPDREIGVSHEGRSHLLKARSVIIATGALERPFPVPGWTMPGVMTVGGAQTLLKSSGLIPSGRVVLAGSGPLLWLFAAQTLRAGGSIEAMLDTAPRANWRRAAAVASAFVVSPYLRKGMMLLAKVRRNVRVVSAVTDLEAQGAGRLQSVAFSVDGKRERMPADVLLLHQGVVPNVNLAMAAGVRHTWDDDQLCFVPVLDAYGGTNVDGIAVAGDGAGIGGARVAEERGRLAAIAAVRAIKPGAELPEERRIRETLAAFDRGRAFLDRLYRPADAMRMPSGDTIVCRCEEVTARQIIDTIALGCEGPNQIKAFLRCGMGPCQGRSCGLTVTELIAKARGVPPGEIGYFRLRPPVKPVTLGEFASLAHDKTESAARDRR